MFRVAALLLTLAVTTDVGIHSPFVAWPLRAFVTGAHGRPVSFSAVTLGGDLIIKVRLVTTAAKPEDPPITEFQAKVPALGPQELKEVTATATTKLRIYELPDWQFIRAEVDILAPAP